MKKTLTFLLLFGVSTLIYSVLKPSHSIKYSYYHWTSTYHVQANEKNPPRYVKVLDISFSDTLHFRKTMFKTEAPKNMIPLIYLDNPLWKKMKAKTMVRKILKSLKKMPLNDYKEIQVDCDWTGSSKASYFKFLKLLKEKSGKIISVTIRLHQVKYYKKTGVPPVDQGVLMYYNMSDFQDIETKNYILDLKLAKQYHYNFETYPLPLNLALPLYSQATIMRFAEVVSLMEGVREEDLDNQFKKVEEHLYVVQETHYFRGKLFYEGDNVRVDSVSFQMLQESIDSLKKVMKKPKEVIFYRWGNRNHYEPKKLQALLNAW
jgi:hypothetical protein